MSNSGFGVLKNKDEFYGFEIFKPQKEKTVSRCQAGIFIKVNKRYVLLSNETYELLNNPTYITVCIDESGKRLLFNKVEAKTENAMHVLIQKKGHSQRLIQSSALVKKMKEMYGEYATVYGHHVGRMADETNGIIFSAEDTFK